LDRQRIDKWLWHARTVRTRTDAAELVSSGHVRLNGQRMRTPGHALKIGDVVTLALDRTVRILEVTGFVERRGGPPEARATYLDRSADQPSKG
jgi:ribosome-associated heat shock protein Hsp15